MDIDQIVDKMNLRPDEIEEHLDQLMKVDLVIEDGEDGGIKRYYFAGEGRGKALQYLLAMFESDTF